MDGSGSHDFLPFNLSMPSLSDSSLSRPFTILKPVSTVISNSKIKQIESSVCEHESVSVIWREVAK